MIRTNAYFSQYNYQIDDETMATIEQYEGMLNAMMKQIFNEFIDSDHDGAATLEEIEMVSEILKNFKK